MMTMMQEDSAAAVADACLPRSVSLTFWLAFIMLSFVASSVYVVAEMFPRKYRAFHYTVVMLAGVSALAYLAQANGMGITLLDARAAAASDAVSSNNNSVGDGAQRCYYALRWIDLMTTLPIAVLGLSLVSTTYTSSTLFLMGTSSLMIGAGLLGGLVHGHNHWLFFAFNLLALTPLARALLYGFRADATSLMDDPEVERRSALLSSIVLVYVLVYQVMYVLAQSLGVVRWDVDAVIMTTSDALVKTVFAALLLGHRHVLDTIVDLWDEQSTGGGGSQGEGSASGGASGAGGGAGGPLASPTLRHASLHVHGGKGAGGVGATSTTTVPPSSREASALLRRPRGMFALAPSGEDVYGVTGPLLVEGSASGGAGGSAGHAGGEILTASSYQSGS